MHAQVRPNLFVTAELFTGRDDLDVAFIERVGINAIVREAMQVCAACHRPWLALKRAVAWQASDVGALADCIVALGGRPVGSLRRNLGFVAKVRALAAARGEYGHT